LYEGLGDLERGCTRLSRECREFGVTDEDMKAWVAEVGGCIAKNVCAGTTEDALRKEL
jgi:hypothetical protein